MKIIKLDNCSDEVVSYINILQTSISEKDKQINKLINILNTLEKDIELELNKKRSSNDYNQGLYNAFQYVKFKLAELRSDL